MARTKRKTNPLVQEVESSAPAKKIYKTAAYVRLSVEDSGKPGADTIEGQKALLTSFIESKSDMELVALFCDNGRTGTDFDRPQFEKMMEDVRKGRVNCIVVKDLSRIIDKEQHFQIDPVTSPFVLAAFEKYADGATMTEIRDYLNENGITNTRGKPMTYNSVQHLLNNRRYIGEYVYREIVVPDGIPAIVPLDLFERVQEKMAKNKKAPARHKAEDDYLLTTKLFCGHCGAYMCGESGTSRTGVVHHYYKCVSVKKKRAECHKKPVKKRWIEDLVVAETMKMVMDDDVVDAIVSMLMDLQGRENTNLPLYQRRIYAFLASPFP